MSQKLLDKAERAIAAATTMRREGDADFAANRAYYAMFYVATALLNERGLQFRKHSAVHAAFGKEFAQSSNLDPKFHRWLIDAFDKRSEADYQLTFSADSEAVEKMTDQAREFLDAARKYLQVH